tara:strand:- start:5 stop:967 length:963 start_codon:yes stop_codon:yes gene_type:complete
MDDNYKPWIEKYRPQDINDVLLDVYNKDIITNIIKKKYFPNLLLYGPPGTGKTTTIINLIKEYSNNDTTTNNNVIHLNASDDRGIDVIRNQIYNFIHYKQIYNDNIKFVILDEVDYMTKSAQNSLKQLIKKYDNVRFCLICNYISKIIKPLQNMFLKLYFYNNKKEEILNLLNVININEDLKLSHYSLSILIDFYETDIRSMINHLQIMQNTNNYNIEIINEDLYSEFINIIKGLNNNTKNFKKIQIIENKIKIFFYKNNLMFDSLYLKILDELKNEIICQDIIDNMKLLYYDSLNSFEDKIKFLIYQIYIPFYETNLSS